MTNCCVPDCDDPVLVKKDGLCRKHYYRLRRTGTLDDPKPRTINLCTIEGCSSRVEGHGLCAKHWMRNKRHGDPTKRVRQRDEGPPEVRWMQKVSVQSPGCWIWTAGTTGKTGYGAFHDGTRSITAHKFVYELLVGPTPDGMELDHLCRVRLCCNPDHLEPVTHAVNTARGIVGMTVVNDPEYRAKRAAYMRDYMAKRRAAEATQTG